MPVGDRHRLAVFGSLLSSRYRDAVDDRLAGIAPPDVLVLDEVNRNVQHGIAASRTARPPPRSPTQPATHSYRDSTWR